MIRVLPLLLVWVGAMASMPGRAAAQEARTDAEPLMTFAQLRSAGQTRMLPMAGSPLDRLRGFSITLVQGDAQGSSTSEGLPAAAAKALADMKDFLPYKHYTLLDSQWTIGASRIHSRLRGPEGRVFELDMVAQSPVAFTTGDQAANAPILIAEFHVRGGLPGAEVAADEGGLAEDRAKQDRAETLAALERRLKELKDKGLNSQHPDTLEAQKALADARMKAAGLSYAAAGQASIIDTSFRMAIGETVVVGTSRLQGDKALIVLLTAVGK
jgi:hypothetical protein